MTVNNKAFISITSIGAAGDGTHNGLANAAGVTLDSDNNVVSASSACSIVFGYYDTIHSIHEALANNLRTSQSDPDLVVIFVETHG